MWLLILKKNLNNVYVWWVLCSNNELRHWLAVVVLWATVYLKLVHIHIKKWLIWTPQNLLLLWEQHILKSIMYPHVYTWKCSATCLAVKGILPPGEIEWKWTLNQNNCPPKRYIEAVFTCIWKAWHYKTHKLQLCTLFQLHEHQKYISYITQ